MGMALQPRIALSPASDPELFIVRWQNLYMRNHMLCHKCCGCSRKTITSSPLFKQAQFCHEHCLRQNVEQLCKGANSYTRNRDWRSHLNILQSSALAENSRNLAGSWREQISRALPCKVEPTCTWRAYSKRSMTTFIVVLRWVVVGKAKCTGNQWWSIWPTIILLTHLSLQMLMDGSDTAIASFNWAYQLFGRVDEGN